MNPAQSLAWLVSADWTLPQLAGIARVSTTAVRSWLQWRTEIPWTPGLRLMIAAYLHRSLLVYLEPPAPNGRTASNAAADAREAPEVTAAPEDSETPETPEVPTIPPRIRSFADLVARHCR